MRKKVLILKNLDEVIEEITVLTNYLEKGDLSNYSARKYVFNRISFLRQHILLDETVDISPVISVYNISYELFIEMNSHGYSMNEMKQIIMKNSRIIGDKEKYIHSLLHVYSRMNENEI